MLGSVMDFGARFWRSVLNGFLRAARVPETEIRSDNCQLPGLPPVV
jgi:hypothetical protein